MDFGANKSLTGGLALQTLVKHTKNLLIQAIFLSVAIILNFILKKIILINLQIIFKECNVQYVHPVIETFMGTACGSFL